MYGRGPASNEIEVSIFGPGFGEAIAIHIGDGRWILVDSCIDPDYAAPASLHYLRSIGADPKLVRAVIASHWHDDHVRGISELVAACPTANFFLSGVFNDKEAMTFLAAYGGATAAAQTGGAKELYKIVDESANANFAYQRVTVHEEEIRGRNIRIVAFSPTANAQKQSLLHMAGYIPQANAPINHAPELSPNLEAVVLHVDLGSDAILLGSDLEDQGTLGWEEIVNNSFCYQKQKASIFKVAHHGSLTGHHSRIWSELLVNGPIAALTPFNNGSVHLPKTADKARLRKVASVAYLTSNATSRPTIPYSLRKRMSAICRNLRRRDSTFGVVRARKRLSSSAWKIELFGRAAQP